MICFPNAKINLGLNIISKREDGFHNIESIFYPLIGLNDVLEVIENIESSENIFHSTGILIPGDSSDNLCLRAMQLMKSKREIPALKIHLHKNIPIGAGLGGGSADASFFIKLVNEKYKLDFTNHEMIEMAASLGSDCAFFINNQTAYATDKGQILEPIQFDIGEHIVVLVFSSLHISTKVAYAGISPRASEHQLKSILQLPIKEWRSYMKNDFEATVFKMYPELEETKEWLYASGAAYASMTGTGSTVFGIFNRNEFDETMMKRSKFDKYYIA
jgi:4-diphosphocytidyl-2-C-methyl-D-erythritol kinase